MLRSDVGIGKQAIPSTMVPATSPSGAMSRPCCSVRGDRVCGLMRISYAQRGNERPGAVIDRPLAVEASYSLADPVDLCLRHADEQRQRQALPRIPVRDWEALGISYEAGQRRLGMQRHRIMEAGFDSRSPHIVGQPVAVLAAHDVEMEHMIVVHNLR